MHCIKKSHLFSSKILPVILVLNIVITGLISVSGSFKVNAASGGPSKSGEKFYLDVSNNTEWNPSGGYNLYAVFADNFGNVLSTTAYTKVSDNVYQAAAPAGAYKVETVLAKNGATLPETVVKSGCTRIYFDNSSAKWSKVNVYAWTDGNSDQNAEYPGEAMKKIGNTNYWYYDTDKKYVIFNSASAASTETGKTKTPDLTVPSYQNAVFKSINGSVWETVSYVSKSCLADISKRTAGANEIYIQTDDSARFSKYPYNSRTFSNPKTVYLYNPSWDSAYVTYDLNDPYNTAVKMTPLVQSPSSSQKQLGKGYFKADVPADSAFCFQPSSDNNYGASVKTEIPYDFNYKCFRMNNGASAWCELDDVESVSADYYVEHENSNGIYWADATYFDYLSDSERDSRKWLNNKHIGTGGELKDGKNFNGAEDNWYPFKQFNRVLSAQKSSQNTNWKYPLYFGNFCNADNSYSDSGYMHNSGGWADITSSTNAYNFDYISNNSNGLIYNGKVYNYASVQGLMQNKLSSKGELMATDTLSAPYFDVDWLKSQDLAKIVNGSFPFVATTVTNGGNTYKSYKFASSKSKSSNPDEPDNLEANDNVYFDWKVENGHNVPTEVNYGYGEKYAVKDGIYDFIYGRGTSADGDVSGYGIFPFNNKYGESYYGTKSVPTHNQLKDGNKTVENLDYGFGIRMDMEFRVPKNGTVDGTANGSPITFKYTGDDDLWMYITDMTDESHNSQLVLDMGGDHSQSTGTVNFKTKTSAVNQVYERNPSSTVSPAPQTRYVYLNKDNTDWSNAYCYFFNDSGTVSAAWPGTKMSSYSGGGSNLRVVIPNGADKCVLNNGSNKQTQDIDLKKTGGAFWLGANLSVNQWDTAPSDAGLDSGGSVSTGTVVTNKTNSFEFDSSHTYKMTIFYMERGLLSSNISMEFTMTPASNDLKVHKDIDVSNVNGGISQALAKSDSFVFTPKENGTTKDTSYTLNASSVKTAAPSFTLCDNDTADFNNQFKTGSSVTVEESDSASGIAYSSKWSVVDNDKGKLVSSGSGTSTNAFKLLDSVTQNENDYANLQVNFTNTPKLADINLSKRVVDKDDIKTTVSVNQTFGYKMAVDLGDNSGFKTYPLQYKITDKNGDYEIRKMSADGEFSMSPNDTVTVFNMPDGAKYKITEDTAAGYLPLTYSTNGSSEIDFTDYTTKVLTAGTHNTVRFTNKENPSDTSVTVKKQIGSTVNFEGELISDFNDYTGTLFKFTMKGLPSMEISGSNKTIDRSNLADKEVTSVIGGNITFKPNGSKNDLLYFAEAGEYRYLIFENPISDTASNDGALLSEISTENTRAFLASVTVSGSGSNLVVSKPKFYESTIKLGSDKKLDLTKYTNSDFKESMSEIPVFKNTVKTGSVSINKKDNTNRAVPEVMFNVYKVSGKDAEIKTPDSPDFSDVTNSNGVAEFKNLPIYVEDYASSGTTPEYQWYALKEISNEDTDMYNPNNKVHYFCFHQKDESGNWIYSFTYDYVNTFKFLPKTSGGGMTAFKVVGMCISGFAGLTLCGYLGCSKKLTKKRIKRIKLEK